MSDFFSLVVPTYNEAGNILELLERVHSALAGLPHEIIIVDDNSPDQTGAIVADFAREHSWATVIVRKEERGLSSAVIAGFEAARGSILGVMDADLSHDEAILPGLIQKIKDGSDMAVGSRRISGGGAVEWPWYRRFTSDVATWMGKSLLKLNLSDPMSGYFVCRRSVYEACKHRLSPTGYKILLEIYCVARPRVVSEIAYVFRNRKQGHSKMSLPVIRQYIWMIIRLSRSK